MNKPLLLAVALSLASPAFAADAYEGASAKAKTMREKLAPAPVDKEQVKALADKLLKEGDQLESEVGIENVLASVSQKIKRGRARAVALEASLVELPAELFEDPEAPVRFALMTRYFSHLAVNREEWTVKKNGEGRVVLWSYRLSLDGMLQAVTRTTMEVTESPDGELFPDPETATEMTMSPSDKSVQKRWKATAKELALLGRSLSI